LGKVSVISKGLSAVDQPTGRRPLLPNTSNGQARRGVSRHMSKRGDLKGTMTLSGSKVAIANYLTRGFDGSSRLQ